eukprot:CAMPEP_0172439096 /NCGR_PEP_ID=MMETSP1065-20121228/188_1 /TAXON_ID=265537 /ORGANISM="Amphiprora paludosa, Strain CCMP125" /LENGTH=83 /DNA_ID=CAMNT_0013187723 /DNA_START=116 /DNA_END=367 /DNA_ORIENTATION=-
MRTTWTCSSPHREGKRKQRQKKKEWNQPCIATSSSLVMTIVCYSTNDAAFLNHGNYANRTTSYPASRPETRNPEDKNETEQEV